MTLIQEPTTTDKRVAKHVKRPTAGRNARFGASIEKLEGRQFFSVGTLASATAVPAYRFVTLDSTSGYPTVLYGINNNGIASGLVTNPTTGDSTGIVFKNGVGKKIVLTGALDTETYQINDAGKIAVSFFGLAKIYHAAVYDSVHHTAVILPDVKGARENLAGGINDSGVVVGDTFTNASFQGGVGWTYQNGKYSFFTAPGSDAANGGTATYSINDKGQIVGYVFDAKGAQHGFVKTGASYTLLNVPGATSTVAYGINDQGVVTGSYVSGGEQHGFIYHNGTYTTLDFPGSTGTYITSINNNGDLAGGYIDKKMKFHGFEALLPSAALV